MHTKPSIISRKYTKNRGFIAITIGVWACLVLSTVIALQAQWLFVYIDQQFYKSELSRLEDAANRCLEYAYQLYISGVVPEDFIWRKENITCYGKTGDMLVVVTTTGRFWYKKSKNFI
ncbi:MAG: hypothetical protein KBD47_00680 [Candidatus Pacebacteria bacterium]|jgi:hypothetical protein|nr:hypothetical protein [Candidatus Paceibacterota bacterium]